MERFKPAAPGIHLRELRPCDVCGKGLLKREDGDLPVPSTLNVYRIKIDSLLYDQGAARGVVAITTYFGEERVPGALAIADAMAPDTELLKCFATTPDLLVCWWCFVDGGPLAAIEEAARHRRERREEEAASLSQADGYREPEEGETGDPVA